MKVKIKRIDKTLPLPIYETHGSVGFDLIAREDVRVHSGAIELIPANVIIEVPEGYMLMLASRSSTPKKKGVMQPHGVGIIDLDYCGPKDEIKIQMYNFTEEVQFISRGEKIAQGVFVRVDRPLFEEVEEIKSESRGGFGSTGGHVEQ
ncbi:MAG: dUTP diphosphatase [Candidatus Peregrinibacteria bacterium]|nr:dUTP diphosphatase [Candidatus Peregrinibacteria bacterium]MDZ4244808.1 dUTP diphosphatase [Candidatus Gracilibacteria bacterium]